MTLHPSAAQGYAARSDAYAKGRPDYSPELTTWLRADLALGEGKIALDLGSGTGKFLPTLRATGATVIAIEPVDEMRARLMEANPGVEAIAGSAEHIPLPDDAVDAVTCAQSFHWFANADALAEIRRVLKPGGYLGLIWNVRDERIGWVHALTRIIEPHGGSAPRYGRSAWRQVFPADGFTPLVEKHFSYHHKGSSERVIVDRMLSTSFIAALPPAKQEEIANEIRDLVARTPELAGKNEVAFPYETAVFSCRKLG